MLNLSYNPPKAPKTETFTLTIKDVFNELTEQNICIFNNKLHASLPDGKFHIQQIKKISDFKLYGLVKRLDLIYLYTKPLILGNQFYYLSFAGNDLIIQVYTKLKGNE